MLSRVFAVLFSLWLFAAPSFAQSPIPLLLASTPLPVLTFQTQVNSVVVGSSFTFSGVSIGTAAANRYVIVGAACQAGTAGTFSGVTVAGISASSAVSLNSGAKGIVGIFIAPVPTGTTATIVVNLNQSTNFCSIGVWSAVNLNSATPTATNTTTSNGGSLNLNVSAGGFAIGVSFNNQGQAVPGATWTGITNKEYDILNTWNASGADITETVAQSPLTASVSWSTPQSVANVSASFR